MNILVTGGAGYIGSHTCVQLLAHNHTVVVVDNLANSSPVALERVQEISGKSVVFELVDVLDTEALERVFSEHAIDAVVHFAGFKAVGESVTEPARYYQTNVQGTLNLIQAMQTYDVSQLVFSSSATVYGDPAEVPITEEAPLDPTNPYGRTKFVAEMLLRDHAAANPQWGVVLLRYFNPVGAHPSGLIGEDPRDTPNNLMPYVAQVAIGRLPYVNVFGTDYDTPDGTGIRDYIHVQDLAAGHVAALSVLATPGVHTYNLGTGRAYSVLEMIAAFEAASGQPVPYQVQGRRPGDIAACFASPAKALDELLWQASQDIDAMCRDAWRWQSQNPEGFTR